LVPVVALITAALWLGEDPGPTQVVGAIIIIAGVWVARMAGGTDVEPSY
jgi:drug/metabolite transporter (DMT)-like permease